MSFACLNERNLYDLFNGYIYKIMLHESSYSSNLQKLMISESIPFINYIDYNIINVFITCYWISKNEWREHNMHFDWQLFLHTHTHTHTHIWGAVKTENNNNNKPTKSRLLRIASRQSIIFTTLFNSQVILYTLYSRLAHSCGTNILIVYM